MQNVITDWTRVIRNEILLDFDLDSTPLELMTDGADGSGKEVHVMFFNQNSGNNAGQIKLFFNSPPQFEIVHCTVGRLSFSKTPPSGSGRIWRITKTYGKQLLLHCNDVLVVEIPFSSCPHEYNDTWKQDVTVMAFHARDDTASQYYRPYYTSKF